MAEVRTVFIVKSRNVRQPLNSPRPVVHGVRALRSATNLNGTPPKNPRLPQATPAAFCRSVHSYSQANPLVLMNYVAFVIASGSHWQQFTLSITAHTQISPLGSCAVWFLASCVPLLESFITTPSRHLSTLSSQLFITTSGILDPCGARE
ncbi:hypothetical protein HYPSUDRAFT_307989 [Hypholoma sublateritium FD-334 SS-4]|uniref:Uncharacterized protein n=1 Tax=Hypholoma sublateritium (strain FD-334 SS-4) TaxID=945553 RepID=A0A0D2PCH3_HYPSF|nr:hypothetical protein HYPSUDRAFT_307989 [Hypholoma sublateritium FD-334 SS-4]